MNKPYRNRRSTTPREPLKPEYARAAALRRLGVREYSAAELEGYLRRRGLEGALAQELVQQLCSEGLVSDDRYMGVVVRDQMRRDKGPMAILTKLRQKGVSASLSDVRRLAGAENGQDERDHINEIISRRYPRARSDRAEGQRAYQGLMRRGFPSSLIIQCLRLPEPVAESSDEMDSNDFSASEPGEES